MKFYNKYSINEMARRYHTLDANIHINDSISKMAGRYHNAKIHINDSIHKMAQCMTVVELSHTLSDPVFQLTVEECDRYISGSKTDIYLLSREIARPSWRDSLRNMLTGNVASTAASVVTGGVRNTVATIVNR
jgi:hypothetical protein